MKPQKNPNEWSCLPTAFSIALGMSFESVIDLVGHDGSEITHAGLGEPRNRRGFHIQEMVKVCIEFGLSVTPIEMYPRAAPVHLERDKELPEPKQFDVGGWEWFKLNLFNSNGVVVSRSAVGNGHAMAYQGLGYRAILYDPAKGDAFEFHSLEDTEQRDRFLNTLWRLDERELK